MKTVTLSVAIREDVTARAVKATDGHEHGTHISFSHMTQSMWISCSPLQHLDSAHVFIPQG